MKEICGGGGDRLVLWDVTHVRLAADWTPPPATPAPSPNPNASAAYNDDPDLFATEAPCHVVGSLDDTDSDEGEKDGGDGYDFDAGHDRACYLRGGDEIGGNVYQDDGGGPNMLKGRLDTFHALPRISRLVKKSHGAFKPSMAWLRDSCYIVNLEDIKEVEVLFKRKNAVGIGGRVDRDRDELCFLRNCRRLAPERTRLLTRFDSVIDRFCDVIDAKSG
eukprot:jgi/Undpi1/9620/HiC_scaffold_27.g12076.m1